MSIFCGRPNSFNYLNYTILTFGAWNIGTLLDLQDGAMPKGRTTLVCKDLVRFNIDVAALSESRILDEGRIRIFYLLEKGKLAPEHRIHGMGFVVRTPLVHTHNLLPKAINERLMTLLIPLHHDDFLTLI